MERNEEISNKGTKETCMNITDNTSKTIRPIDPGGCPSKITDEIKDKYTVWKETNRVKNNDFWPVKLLYNITEEISA